MGDDLLYRVKAVEFFSRVNWNCISKQFPLLNPLEMGSFLGSSSGCVLLRIEHGDGFNLDGVAIVILVASDSD